MSAWMVKLIPGLAVAYGVLVVGVYFYQENLLFFPDSRDFLDAPELAARGFAAKSVSSPAGELRYYERAVDQAQGTLMAFHGNAGRAADRDYLLEPFFDLPLNLVLAEYPGYAGSAEQPQQLSLVTNAVALFDHFKSQNDHPITLLGESIGTGVATGVASQRASAGLILISPYPSIRRVAQFHYPYLPVSWLIRNPFPSDEWVTTLKDLPILGFHGEQDEVIPFVLGQELWRKIPDNNRKLWVPVPLALHNDLLARIGPRWGEIARQHFGWTSAKSDSFEN